MVTGGAGFVASHLADYCLEKGDDVIITCRWNEDLHRMQHFKDKVKIEHMELTDLSSIIRVLADNKPEVISHLAAQSFIPYSFQNPIYTINVNTIGTLNILEAIRIIKDYIDKDYDPLVHVCSSSEYYGNVPKENQPISEKHNASPMNPYGVGKVGADFLSQLYEKYYDIRVLITRMFTHTSGRRTMMSAEHYYAKYIAEIEAGKRDKVIPLGNMKSIRTWRDARDAVKDYYELFKKQKTGIYNISGDTSKSIQEVLDYLLSISKLNKNDIQFPVDKSLLRKVDIDCQYANISKFGSEVNQEKEFTFEETMHDILNSWRKRVKNGL